VSRGASLNGSAQPSLRRYLSRLVGQDGDNLLQDVLIIVIRKIQ
jgi:hypothetical protein